jgi:hypothetical protein
MVEPQTKNLYNNIIILDYIILSHTFKLCLNNVKRPKQNDTPDSTIKNKNILKS